MKKVLEEIFRKIASLHISVNITANSLLYICLTEQPTTKTCMEQFLVRLQFWPAWSVWYFSTSGECQWDFIHSSISLYTYPLLFLLWYMIAFYRYIAGNQEQLLWWSLEPLYLGLTMLTSSSRNTMPWSTKGYHPQSYSFKILLEYLEE